MGVVYRARDTKLERDVALKFLPPQLTKDAEAKDRLIHEARAASSLDHPNICTIHEIDETESGQLFICMAHYEGKTLKEILGENPLKIENAVDIAMQIGRGLAKAHKQGIVHRDVKPANIIVTPEGVAKIVDFGLAKVAEDSLAQKAGIMGTAAYMAPEQITGDKGDGRTDIWALGAILYEMLTGDVPFQGVYEQAMMYSILNTDPEPVGTLRPEIPGELARVIETALQKNPGRRYQQMEDLLNDLWSLTQQFELSVNKKKQIQGIDAPVALAIMPFFNMSMEPEKEYLCEGFSQDIRDTLSRIAGLTVTPHSIVLDAREKHEDIRDLGKELKAEALLEGAVRQTDDRLKITTQLINVLDGNHLWAERYDRPLEEILEIKEEICLAILEQLGVEIDGREKQKVTRPPTTSIQAYDAYLNGKYQSHLYLKEALFESVYHFQYAVKEDPDFVEAHTALAKSMFWLGTGDFDIPPGEILPDAEEAVNTALERNKHSANAQAVLAAIQHRYRNNWSEAEMRYKQSLEIEPGLAFAMHNYAMLLICFKRRDEALEYAQAVRERHPRTVLANIVAGKAHFYRREYQEAVRRFADAATANPKLPTVHVYHGYASAQVGEYYQALQSFDQAMKLSPNSAFCAIGKAFGLAVTGEEDSSLGILDELQKRPDTDFVSGVGLARIYCALERREESLANLQKAVDENDPWLPFVAVDPLLRNLHGTSVFDQFLREHLPEFSTALTAEK